MRDTGSQGYRRPSRGQMRFDNRRRDDKRTVLLFIIAALSIAIAVFAILITVELVNRGQNDPVIPDDGLIDEGNGKFKVTELQLPSDNVHKGDLILINNTYPYVFPDTAPSVTPVTMGRTEHGKSASKNPIYSYYTQNGVEKCATMESEALNLLQRWADDFYKASGNSDLFIFDEDGYRTKAEQETKYGNKPAEYAPAGATEHHTGKVIDLYVWTGSIRGNLDDASFAQTFKWVYDNAHKYGFVLRYPSTKVSLTGISYEPYHFRQVGTAHAYYMFKNDLCLEEYLDLIKNDHGVSTPLEFRADDGNNYMVYYVAASDGASTTLTVPAEYDYTVSGDNREGFIVTVNLGR